MDEPSLHRPLLSARTRRNVVSASLVAAALFGAGMLAGAFLHRAPSVEHISVPAPSVNVEVPTAAAPIVSVNVPPPPAPEPAPAPVVPTPSESPTPRPLAPRLWPQCVTYGFTQTETGKVCEWDDGFPAIAADGSLIATKYIPDDGGRGNPGLTIRFLDSHTGKLMKSIVVLSPDKYVDENDTKNAKGLERQQEQIYARIGEAQKILDDGHYRSLAVLGGYDQSMAAEPPAQPIAHKATYAEIDASGATRIIDPATNTVLWQYSFATGGASKEFLDGEGMCGGWGMRRMGLWWDPAERVVVSSQDYQTGGCMCPDETIEQVVRM